MTGQWIKVEFYGRLPDDVDPATLIHTDTIAFAYQAMLAFGFRYVDNLTAVPVEEPHDRRSCRMVAWTRRVVQPRRRDVS